DRRPRQAERANPPSSRDLKFSVDGMEEADLIREEARHLLQRRILGRSRSYARLLEFLVECSLADRSPKEVEIAVEVFDRQADFDPAQDSIVRVYAHNLRRKLDRYYGAEGRGRPNRLDLARGEYRVVLAGGEARDDP